jgi:hypothetical protein
VDRANGAGSRRGGPRILLCPVEIAGYYAGLEAGLRELGVDALAIDLAGNPFRYRTGPARLPVVVRLARRAHAGHRAAASSRLLHPWWKAARIATSLFVLAWAVVRFDVFVFSFGTSFLGLRELPLLRRLGKGMVFVFHGSDARPPYIDGVRMAPDRAMPIADCLALTRRMKASIRWIERYADAVIAQPAFSHFFERPVVNFFAIGVPWRDHPLPRRTDRGDDVPIRILHSPSDPIVKGSARVREVIEQLRSEGLNLELAELRGVPNEVVLREIATCDFVVDQIYSDAPMVGFATEAAVAGKPAIVGGYAWPENHRIFGSDPMPPVEECAPEALADAIRHLATNREHREALGARARTFVTGRWSRTAVAERLLNVVDGSAPAEWLFDPRDLRYLEGCGLSREQARASVAAVVAAGGPVALCVSDKPELERRFLAFASAADVPGAAELADGPA